MKKFGIKDQFGYALGDVGGSFVNLLVDSYFRGSGSLFHCTLFRSGYGEGRGAASDDCTAYVYGYGFLFPDCGSLFHFCRRPDG